MTEPTATSTQLITSGELPESVVNAVAAYAERHGVADLLATATMVARTDSPGEQRRRFWRQKEPTPSYALLSPAWLIVVTTESEVTVTAWRLAGGEVRRITETTDDVTVTGLHITALRFGSAVRETTLVLLAADDEGSAFEKAVLAATVV